MNTYITSADITNQLIKNYPLTRYETYVDEGNLEIEDFYKRLGGDITETPIITPIHYKIKIYINNYINSRFAEDHIGIGAETINENNVYVKMFERSRYLMNDSKQDVTIVCFTGEPETQSNRSVSTQRLYFS